MIALTLSAKDLKEGINYRPFEKVTVLQSETEKKVNFLAESLVKEVLEGTEPQQIKRIKKLKKIIKTSVSMLGVGLGMGTRALANTTATPSLDPITPHVIMDYGLTIALIAVSAGVAMSMILLTVAGIYRMLRKKKESVEWSQDIIKGLVQVLISIPTIYMLYFLAQLLFKNLPMLSGLF